jgi:regulatory protein
MPFARRRPKAEEEKCSDFAKARSRALDILSAQDVCTEDLYRRLCNNYTEQAAAFAVAEMVELDCVNDERYASNCARKLLDARKSRRAAAQYMRQKGLDAVHIEQALDEIYADDGDGENPELTAAAELVEKRYRKKLEDGRRDLVVAALMRRGFAYPVIKEAIQRAEEEE